MRSPNKRSRSKSNRPKNLGNIVNRVFDSSGPEGKVRGTPQQVIEKYQVLARDAQLANDRVAAENFQQHAEHYTRMLAEAQREMAAEQEARRLQQEERNQRQQDDRARHHQRRHDDRRQNDEAQPELDQPTESSAQDSFGVQASDENDETLVVDTPESKSADGASDATATNDSAGAEAPKPANRRKPRASQDAGNAPATAEGDKPKVKRAPRRPRKSEATDTPEAATKAAE